MSTREDAFRAGIQRGVSTYANQETAQGGGLDATMFWKFGDRLTTADIGRFSLWSDCMAYEVSSMQLLAELEALRFSSDLDRMQEHEREGILAAITGAENILEKSLRQLPSHDELSAGEVQMKREDFLRHTKRVSDQSSAISS